MKLTKSMFKQLWAVLMVFITLNSKAQFRDYFDDGNISNNPQWRGDTAKFKIISGKLNSKTSVINDKFYIATVSKRLENTQWEFWVNLQFNTSSANYIEIFLTSDSANLSGKNSGYFLRIGNTSDNISLFRKNGLNSTLLINGKTGVTNHTNNLFKIKVICDSKRNLTLWHDSTGTGDQYLMEGSIRDTALTNCNFFGIYIRQSTASFHNKHFFDDFYIGKIIRDTTAPVVTKVEMISPDTVHIHFSEPLSLASSGVLNFEIDKGIDNPQSARFISADSSVIEIILKNKLTPNTGYILKN